MGRLVTAQEPLTWVLIPGAGGSAWYWHLVERELRAGGDDVVPVELPADDDEAGLPAYVETTLAAVARHRGALPRTHAAPGTGAPPRTDARPGRVVVVAASLGAFTAPLLCQRLPVSLLVLVNGMIPRPGETPGEWWSNTGQPAARREAEIRAGRPPDAEFDVETCFFHDVPPAVFEEAGKHERAESDAVFGSRLELDAWPDVPTRVVVGHDDRLFPADFQRRVARERLGLAADEIPGGHLVSLSNPTGVTELLRAYVRDLRRD